MHWFVPSGPEQGGSPPAYMSRYGTVHLVHTPDPYNFYIDARFGHTAASLREVLKQAADWGLEPVDPDDRRSDTDLFDDGTIRFYLEHDGPDMTVFPPQ